MPAASAGSRPHSGGWARAQALIEYVERVWQRPDDGIWEVRGGRRHFTHSKVMAWVAIDRAVQDHRGVRRTAATRGATCCPTCGRCASASTTRCASAASTRASARSRSPTAATRMDASVLVMPHVGFLPASDPRVAGTVAAVEKTLLRDGFVLRYDTTDGTDGLPGVGGRLPRVQLLARRQLRHGGSPRRGRGAVRPAARACAITSGCSPRSTTRCCSVRSATSPRRSRTWR